MKTITALSTRNSCTALVTVVLLALAACAHPKKAEPPPPPPPIPPLAIVEKAQQAAETASDSERKHAETASAAVVANAQHSVAAENAKTAAETARAAAETASESARKHAETASAAVVANAQHSVAAEKAKTAAETARAAAETASESARKQSDSASTVAASAAANLKRLEGILIRQFVSRKQAAHPLTPLDDYIPCELTFEQTIKYKLGNGAEYSPIVDLASALESLTNSGIGIDVALFNTTLANHLGETSPIKKTIDELSANKKIIPKPGQTPEDAANVATTALTGAITNAVTPSDMACSMVMMPWQLAADNFGRHVADQFIVFQVVMRNLNTTQEFLMHNVSIAVDDQRFYSGMDKLVVRNTQSHGQVYDRRNFSMRALEVAGDIAAGISPFGNTGLQATVGVVRSAVIPGMGKLFQDRYLEQIHALNDLAFSSSMAYKIVVPIKGAAPFVTFLPADIFSRKIGTPSKTKVSSNDKDWHYKNWSPDELHSFTERTYVIASGIHVQEVHNDQPSLTSIDCKGAAGTIDLSKADSGGTALTCSLKGENLDKVLLVRLKNAIETTDTVKAEAAISLAGGQNTSATVAFQVADIKALKGKSYGVFVVTGPNATELPTSQTLGVAATATTATVSVKVGGEKCDPSSCGITIAGSNLAQAKLFLLQDAAGSKLLDSGEVKAVADNSGVTLTLTHLDQVAAGDYQLILQNAGANLVTIPTKVSLVPLLDKLDPAAYPPTSPCAVDCVFTLTGKRLEAMVSASLVDGAGKETAAQFDLAKKTLTISKAVMDALDPGSYKVNGKTAEAAVTAVSNATLTVAKK